MNFCDIKIKNRPFNVPIYGRIFRSLVLKLVWKSLQALKFSNSLTFPEFWIKCQNSLIFRSNIKFPDFSRFSRLRSNPVKNTDILQNNHSDYCADSKPVLAGISYFMHAEVLFEHFSAHSDATSFFQCPHSFTMLLYCD